ncbi:MAG: histidinol-phosphate transaminase [Burkholderiales bacterium]|nr:histidinol-phosphate transaminase [Burkholderiales bacterium]
MLRPEILALSAYHVADARGLIKLDAMENPYGLPPELRAEVARIAADAALNRYPDPQAKGLKRRLRIAMGVPAAADVMIGNGSDEIIQILTLAVARPGAVILGVEPSFVMFRMLATFAGARFVGVPLASDFSLDAEALLAAIAEHRPALIFLAYPNNPTGNLFDPAVIRRVIEAAPGIVVVDEAYHAFAERSFLPALEQYPNLLVMRTLSKLGLAGLRLGFLVGAPDWIGQLDKVRLPYNINVLSQCVAETVLAHGDALDRQTALLRDERALLAAALAAVPGVEVFPSAANFLLFRVAQASIVFEALRARGVLIKRLDGAHPLLADCLRVTVGAPEENAAFLGALRAALGLES